MKRIINNNNICIVSLMFLTAQKHVGHDWQVLQADFALDIAVSASDFVQCPALILSPVMLP